MHTIHLSRFAARTRRRNYASHLDRDGDGVGCQ
ncbi:excalibur calcium-binding domain-containing protein [Nocardioides sp. Root151]